MPPPRTTRVFFQKSSNTSLWEVMGDNFDDEIANADDTTTWNNTADSNSNSNSRPRRRASVEGPALNMDESSSVNNGRPQRRAKQAAIQGLQLAQAEEERPFSHFMDPEETRERQGKASGTKKAPAKQAPPKGAKATTATSKLELEAFTDRVEAPPLAKKLKRSRTPTRRLADEQQQLESRTSPREIDSPLTGSHSEKLTVQPATAASTSARTESEKKEEKCLRQPTSQSLSDPKKNFSERIQRGRTMIAGGGPAARNARRQQSAAIAKRRTEVSEPQETRTFPRENDSPLTWSHSEKPTVQPATAASTSAMTESEKEKEKGLRRPTSQSLSDPKKNFSARIQRGRTMIAGGGPAARNARRQQLAASAKRQAEVSEPRGGHDDEEPASHNLQGRNNRLLDPRKRDSLTLLSSASPEATSAKRKKSTPSGELHVDIVDIAAGDENDQVSDVSDHAPVACTTCCEVESEAIKMSIAHFMVGNVNQSTVTQQDSIIGQKALFQSQDTAEDSIISNNAPKAALFQSQEQDTAEDSQRAICDNAQQDVDKEQIANRNVNIQLEEQDAVKASQNMEQEKVADDHGNIQSQEQDAAKDYQNGQDSLPSYSYTKDPNDVYVEEEAYLYHNPPLPTKEGDGVSSENLRPIPPPPTSLPPLPNTGYCKWSWDEPSRVLLADFSGSEAPTLSTMDLVDEKFFLEMLERDDITVISAGLVSPSKLDHGIWNLEYISQVLNDEYFHKIRRFDTVAVKGVLKCVEKDRMISMKPCDYVQYIRQRRRVFREPISEEKEMTFTDHAGGVHSINVETTALYMIDLDIGKLLPKMYSNFIESMRMPGVLPGGAHCMMSAITSNAQPFMGPNLYITPPASFTYFHQDGHGTVDSGHLCVSGYNEIIMLRRLTERHKQHALWLLTGDRNRPDSYFDGLYEEPHSDGLGEKPAWPTSDRIDDCAKMGYCPSLCILKPGQMIHINKGRLHAFRKLSTHKLPEDDCHATLRANLVQEENLQKEQLCISVAWDWMYRGVTAEGINREVCTTLECAELNRKNKKMSLAIPELSLLHMSRSILSEDPLHNSDGDERKIFGFELNDEYNKARPYEPSSEVICRGILPGLRHIVKHHVNVMQRTKAKNAPTKATDRVSIMERPNADENPLSFSVDPYGVGDFFCKLCYKELSNVYFHCDGCEQILSKDFNICEECHSGKEYKKNIQMHPVNNKKHSTINHTGGFHFDRQSRCPCKNGPVCKLCGFCSGCSCRCHSYFTLNCRFFNEESEQKLASRLELLLEKKTGSKLPQDDGTHTEQRLSFVT